MNRLTTCLLIASGIGVALAADDIPPPREVVDVAALVKQLGSEDYAEREAATTRLSSLALDPSSELLAATKSDNPEVRGRAVKAAESMRRNVAIVRMPRGERFAQQGKVDLFVAATAVWDLKADDPRLWVPAVDLGRRLIDKADMKGDRRPLNCPSTLKGFADYVKRCGPLFTRMDVTYFRPDPRKASPPILYRNEAIQAPGVVGVTGMTYNLIVSRGGVQTQTAIQASVVFANGDVTAVTGLYSVVIVCDGDVTLTDDHISKSLIIARGNITSRRGVTASTLIAGGKVILGEKMRAPQGRHNEIKENESNPLGYVTFFEVSTVGVEVRTADKAVAVAKVAEGQPFAAAGVKPGDVVAAVNGKTPDSAESLRRLLRDALAVGDATLTLKRGDRTETVKVTLPE